MSEVYVCAVCAFPVGRMMGLFTGGAVLRVWKTAVWRGRSGWKELIVKGTSI